MLFNLRRPVAILAAAICATGVAAGPGIASSHVTGGTLNVDLATDVDSTDPALAYLNTSWEIEYATGLKLVNYPDAEAPRGSRLVPASRTASPSRRRASRRRSGASPTPSSTRRG